MRLLVISREIPPVGGGAGRVALDLAEYLAERGHDVHILTMHHRDLPELESRGRVVIQRLHTGRRHRDSAHLPSMLRFLVRARREALRLTRGGGFDLIHAHAIVPDGLSARSVGRRRRIPFVVTAHGTDVPGYDEQRFRRAHSIASPGWHRVVRDASLLTTPSTYLRDLIRRRAPAAVVTVIPNGIGADLSLDRTKHPSYLIVSRLVARKNYAAFFEAIRSIPETIEVHVAGDGPEMPGLIRLAGQTHHAVTFHGWLDHGSEQWRDLYERCRFFVSPSLAENFPVNLLEAQLAGMTVLATPIAGNKEVLGDAAIFFDGHAPAAILRTIHWSLEQNPAHLDEIGRRARDHALEQFSWDAVGARFERGFSEVVERSSHH